MERQTESEMERQTEREMLDTPDARVALSGSTDRCDLFAFILGCTSWKLIIIGHIHFETTPFSDFCVDEEKF